MDFGKDFLLESKQYKMKKINVSIIIPEHKPNKELLKKVLLAVKKQKYSGKKELIEVNKGLGLAASMNYGIRKAKYPLIVSLHQDCIPEGSNWLSKLIKPLKKEQVVATCSDVYDVENKKKYTPGFDEKGCAYKKFALKRVGYFDDKTFLNSGEDLDIYLKLTKIGKIEEAHCVVNHYHPGYLGAKGYKRLQNANTSGCLFRLQGFHYKSWWKAFILANIFNPKYFYWYWRGFIKGKQDFKR